MKSFSKTGESFKGQQASHLKTKQEDKRSPIYGDRPSCRELFYKWKFSTAATGFSKTNTQTGTINNVTEMFWNDKEIPRDP